jgi:hypothetical protein
VEDTDSNTTTCVNNARRTSRAIGLMVASLQFTAISISSANSKMSISSIKAKSSFTKLSAIRLSAKVQRGSAREDSSIGSAVLIRDVLDWWNSSGGSSGKCLIISRVDARSDGKN